MAEAKNPYLAAQLSESALRAVRRGQPSFSKFLDPAEALLAEQAARKQCVGLRLWGGYPEAERCIAGFFAGHPENEADLAWPIHWLRCRWQPRYGEVHHRDLLGALMAQGVERYNLGDFILGEGEAYCAVLPEMADYLAGVLTQAGRATLTCDVVTEAPVLPEAKGSVRHETVASLRLDAVLAAGFHLSRSEAADWIRAGKVRLNHLPEERIDAALAEGALLSARGLGRLRLLKVGAVNRKGRIAIELMRYE